MNQGTAVIAAKRAVLADSIRQHQSSQQQQQQQASDVAETATIRRHAAAVKAAAVRSQRQRSQSIGDAIETNHHEPEQQEQNSNHTAGVVAHRRSDGEVGGSEPPEVYENIDDLHRAKVNDVFDAAFAENEATSTPNMLSLAEDVRQKLIQQRSRQSSTTSSPTSSYPTQQHPGDQQQKAATAAVVPGPRPVASQRSRPPSDPASEFQQMLAEKVEKRRLSQAVNSDPGAAADRPPGLLRAVSAEAAAPAARTKPPPLLKQKPKLAVVSQNAAPRQQARASEAPRPSTQRRSAEVAQQPVPPLAAPVDVQDDFDLPPPPEEYCNLPEVVTKPTATVPRGPPPSREIAGKFRHPTTAVRTPVVDQHDLPPPPSGFHDDVQRNPPPPAVYSQPAPTARTSNAARSAGNAGGLAASRRMSDWSCDDVARWLESLNMPNHCAAFRAYCVDGRVLVQLTDDDLYNLGVSEFGQRRMLQRNIMIEQRGDSS